MARRFTADERITLRKRAAALYLAGSTIRSTGKQLGLPYSTTRDFLVDADVPLRGRGGAQNRSVR